MYRSTSAAANASITPGAARAAVRSTACTVPWARSLRTTVTWTIPGRLMSAHVLALAREQPGILDPHDRPPDRASGGRRHQRVAHDRIPVVIASTIPLYPVQRQRLPAIASLTSSRVGVGLFCKSAYPVIRNPGVQNPHCSAWDSANARWSGWSSSEDPSPSTVVSCTPVCLDGEHQA